MVVVDSYVKSIGVSGFSSFLPAAKQSRYNRFQFLLRAMLSSWIIFGLCAFHLSAAGI